MIVVNKRKTHKKLLAQFLCVLPGGHVIYKSDLNYNIIACFLPAEQSKSETIEHMIVPIRQKGFY